ncbi:uncharacterized protein [Engystomops pustulosus]|uniref:uncharacterized protein isoform X2 n=1 Tax=Engystomops pustulosus TaxID=76066 RepID=UPI003AFA81AD
MRPRWVVYQLLLFCVLKGDTKEDSFGNLGFNFDHIENHSAETDFYTEFDPSSMLAFVAARSCHSQLTGDHGTFSPPVFYGKVDVNLWCNWTILASPGKHIVIYITGFQTNKTCSHNRDEIIFEGTSSSVENAIVYACWNKRTHVFATQATAVSVVLLWRSFSTIGSNRYFDGRYYVFNDPLLGPSSKSGNCSSSKTQSNVIKAPKPDKRPTTKLNSVLPKSSSSSKPYFYEAHHTQELMETLRPTSTVDQLLDAITHDGDVSRVTTLYNTSRPHLAAVTQSMALDEGHQILQTAGELEPSLTWEPMSESIWTWRATQTEYLSETSSLILSESIYASTIDIKDIGRSQHFTAQTPAEPSLISDLSHSNKTHTIMPIKKLQLSVKVNMQYLNTAHAFDLQKNLLDSVDKPIEPFPSKVTTVHHIDFSESEPLTIDDNTELLGVQQWTVTNNGDLPEMQHFSAVHASENLQLQILPLTDTVQFHPKKTVSEQPWGGRPYPPAPYFDFLSKSHLYSTHASSQKAVFTPSLAKPSVQKTYRSVFLSPLTTPMSLDGIMGDDNAESHMRSQIALPKTTPPIVTSTTSVFRLQIKPSKYWTNVEPTLDPSSPQSTLDTLEQQLILEGALASHPIPEVPTKLIHPKSILKMSMINEYISNLETGGLPTSDYEVTKSPVQPTERLDQWSVKDHLESTDLIGKPESYVSSSRELISNTFSYMLEDIQPQAPPSHLFLPRTDHSDMDTSISTIDPFGEEHEKTTYSYQTNPDLDLHENTAGQARGGNLNEQDITYILGNETELEFLHEPGDSLFVITMEIENKDFVLKGLEKDLVQAVIEKITERMIYFPSGVNSLILKGIRWTNDNRVTLTFWLQLFQGGKEMRNFLITQLKSLENFPLGSSNATLVAFTIEDVNECELGIQSCHKDAHCFNMVGSYSCSCMEGYEDLSATAPGTLCISSKMEEHLEILIAAIVTVAVAVLLIIIILCVVQQKRRAKVKFSKQDSPTREHGGHHPGQPLSSPSRHLPPRHSREHHTARDTSSTLELTKITIEQAAC